MKNWKEILLVVLAVVVIVLGILLVQAHGKIIKLENESGVPEIQGEPSLNELDEAYRERLKQELIKEIEEGRQEYTKLYENLTTENISEALKRPRMLGNLEITNIQLTGENNITRITADVTNKGEETDGDFPVTLRFLNDEGRNLIEIGAYINRLEPGETTVMTTSTTTDFVNAYDFEIIK